MLKLLSFKIEAKQVIILIEKQFTHIIGLLVIHIFSYAAKFAQCVLFMVPPPKSVPVHL